MADFCDLKKRHHNESCRYLAFLSIANFVVDTVYYEQEALVTRGVCFCIWNSLIFLWGLILLLQLFGLVNTLLANSRLTAEKDLSIQRYSVIPLSPNSGLIGWVPNCDTLHHLIREYREPRKACYLAFNPPKIFLLFMNHGWLQQGMCFSVFAPPPPQVLEEQKNASLSE